MIQHPRLYRKDAKGVVRVWWMESDAHQYRTCHCTLGGIVTESDWTACTAKNVGKANELTPEAQALKEVDAQYTKKLERKYARSVEELDSKTIIWPMLAAKFKGDLKEGHQYFCQPKLDGLRCLAYLKDGKVVLQTREGKFFEHMGHIAEALEPLFERWPTLVLDGELYNHEFKDDLPSIVSAVKGGHVEQQELIQYHVYDCIPLGPDRFSWRSSWLKSVIDRLTSHPIVWVQTHHVTNMLTLNSLYEHYLAQGYEGQMIRKDGPYEQGKRSTLLAKRKEFQDSEFPVVAITAGVGNWAGMARICTVRLPDGSTSDTDIAGSREFCRSLLALWATKPDLETTVTHFGYTPNGKLRFGKAKVFWEGKRDL
jgi:ATP-dependent DNA ligase